MMTKIHEIQILISIKFRGFCIENPWLGKPDTVQYWQNKTRVSSGPVLAETQNSIKIVISENYRHRHKLGFQSATGCGNMDLAIFFLSVKLSFYLISMIFRQKKKKEIKFIIFFWVSFELKFWYVFRDAFLYPKIEKNLKSEGRPFDPQCPPRGGTQNIRCDEKLAIKKIN